MTHSLSPGIPHWPGDPPVEFQDWADIGADGYSIRRFSMSEHAGTHMSAPASFYPSGRTIDQYPAEELVRPAALIDVREQAQANPDYALTLDDLASWESNHGVMPTGSIVLLHTGWGERWHNPADYLGADSDGALRFPGFGVEAATLLVDVRGAAGLGTDTAGVEPGSDDSFAVSRLVLGRSLIALQNLANLHRLPPTGAWLVIGLLPLVGGSGSPAAVTALVPR